MVERRDSMEPSWWRNLWVRLGKLCGRLAEFVFGRRADQPPQSSPPDVPSDGEDWMARAVQAELRTFEGRAIAYFARSEAIRAGWADERVRALADELGSVLARPSLDLDPVAPASDLDLAAAVTAWLRESGLGFNAALAPRAAAEAALLARAREKAARLVGDRSA